MDFVNNSTKFAHIIANPSENASQNNSQRTKLIEDVNLQIGKNLADDIKVIKNNFSSKETEEEFPEEMVGKLHKICRCCLAEDVKLRDIYDENERIAEMLMNFAQIQISPEDILPPVICFNCCVQIERVYEFKNQIEMAESTLRQLVNANSYQVVQSYEKPEDMPEATETQISEESNSSANEFPDNGEESVLRCTPQEVTRQQVEVIKLSSKTKQQAIICDRKDENQEQQTITKETCDEERNEKFANSSEETEEGSIHCPKDLSCYICNEGFTDKNEFKKHFKNHVANTENIQDKNLPYKCTECNESFRIESDLEIHNSLHAKDGKKQCSFCKKEVTTTIQLKRHIKTHFKDKPHKCKICDKGFPEMGSLTRHLRSHSGQQRIKKHLCTVCGKGYYDAYSLSVHTRNHTGERPCICSICGKTFIDCRLLNSHMKIHSEIKPHKCSVCQRTFTHQSTLTTHLRTHTGEKPYVCTVCGKSFIQSSNMSLHMRTHSGVKPYKCETCGRAFASSSTLITHNRIHTGEKPYKCGMCGKAFARLDLKAHIRTHTGEKPFQCSGLNCHKKFTTRGQLNQHMRIHREERSFVCKICQKRCYSSGNLKSHMKTHENLENVQINESILSNAIPNEVIIYAKNDLNPLIVQEIDINTGEEASGLDRKSNIVNFQIQGIPEEGNRQCSSQLSSESSETTTKYIVSNVIQVPFFINSSDCQNVDEII